MAQFVSIDKNHQDNTFTADIDPTDQDYHDIMSSIWLAYTEVKTGDENDIRGLIYNEPDMEIYMDDNGYYFGVINQ